MRGVGWILLLAAIVAAEETAFVGVTIVPMDGERVLEEHTVVVKDGRIAALGRDVAIPDGARRIDGAGLYLMPGLADMHVHNWYEEEHLLFLANGVTTVRNLWGRRFHLRWAQEIETGDRLGPTLFTTGAIIDGNPAVWQNSRVAATIDEAKSAVASQKLDGFEAIKVYNRLKPDVYAELIKQAKARGMRVTGHVPWGVPMARVFELKQDCIEHLEGYLGHPWRWDEKAFTELARETVRAGVWNCPTLIVYHRLVPADEAAALHARPEMRYVPPRLRATWDPKRDFRTKAMTPEQFKWMRQWNALRMKAVRILRDQGARLLVGTDCGNPFVVAGWSVHDELALFVKAGLKPYEALRAATHDAAEYLGRGGEFGTVTVGKRADLLLLRGNPLEDVGHAARPVGVMVRGRWLPAAELRERLDALADAYGQPRARFARAEPLPDKAAFHYEISWNGVVVGEERFVVVRNEDETETLVAQQANDPPWSSLKTIRATFDESGTKVKGVYESVGHEEVGAGRFDSTVLEDTLWAHPALSSWIVVGRRLHSLAVGERKSFHFREADEGEREDRSSVTATVTRLEDRDGGRVYAITFTRRDGTTKSTIRYDGNGVPVERRDELQQGEVVYRRVPAR